MERTWEYCSCLKKLLGALSFQTELYQGRKLGDRQGGPLSTWTLSVCQPQCPQPFDQAVLHILRARIANHAICVAGLANNSDMSGCNHHFSKRFERTGSLARVLKSYQLWMIPSSLVAGAWPKPLRVLSGIKEKMHESPGPCQTAGEPPQIRRSPGPPRAFARPGRAAGRSLLCETSAALASKNTQRSNHPVETCRKEQTLLREDSAFYGFLSERD